MLPKIEKWKQSIRKNTRALGKATLELRESEVETAKLVMIANLRIGTEKPKICQKAFVSFYNISKKRVELIASHIGFEEALFPRKYSRGRHGKRPNIILADLLAQIDTHIKHYPRRTSHYSTKNKLKRYYLSPELKCEKNVKVFQVLVQIPKVKDSGQKFLMNFFTDILKQTTTTSRLGILVVTHAKNMTSKTKLKTKTYPMKKDWLLKMRRSEQYHITKQNSRIPLKPNASSYSSPLPLKENKLANVMLLAKKYVPQVDYLVFYQNLKTDAAPDEGETDVTDDEDQH
ncbi:unnamed protein product [Psylliodes chrysocephalus]|uniref:Uncharacterized protein n=1 Tax=Psylliodes chrysocephalus TaxID=3402493 RepID=A0A9P0GJF4_9CUCU|nr:unnamed protein product [Psylliodes chrysocephala]